jgi:hypothetical protein
MKNSINIVKLLQPLFNAYELAMKPASDSSLNLFTARAVERQVSDDVIMQMVDFYSIVDGIPCLNSLDVHRCEDVILFEWWDQQELWLGQRDFYTLRWSQSKERFCIGDASEVSFSTSDEYRTFAEALRHMVTLHDVPGSDQPAA